MQKQDAKPKGEAKQKKSATGVKSHIKGIGLTLKTIQRRHRPQTLFECTIPAGFPSPAENEVTTELDLNDLLIKHPIATFFVRVSGSSMIKAGIHHNDILVVDRSLEPAHGKIVIAMVNGEFTVKRLRMTGQRVQLAAENDAYQPIDITEGTELSIWGVVTSVIHLL